MSRWTMLMVTGLTLLAGGAGAQDAPEAESVAEVAAGPVGTAPAASFEPPIATETFSLRDAMQSAVKNNPSMRAVLELEVQSKAQRDRAFAFIQPTISAGYQHRVNDREIAFDASESFDTSALTDAFTPIYGNLGFIYGQMFEEGWLSPEDCDELATINGFADCAELTDAFLNGGGLGDDDDDDTEAPEPLVVQPKTQNFLNLQFQWPLSPRVITLAQAGQHGVEASRAQIRQARDQLQLGVLRAYAGAWQAQETVEVLKEQVALAEAHLRDTQSLEAAGFVTRDVLLRAQLEVEKVRRGLRDAGQFHRQALRGLRMAMGTPEVQLARIAPLPTVSLEKVDATKLGADAQATRPETAAAEAQAAAARSMEIDAILEFLPQVAVTGNLNWSDQAAGFDSKQTSWWVGVGVSLPIWDGGLKIQNTRSAASRKRQAAANVESVRQQVAMEVENAWDGYTTKRDSVSVARLEEELATEAYRLVQVRYQAGKARQVELLDAQTVLAFAELGLLQAQVDRELAAAEVLAAAGRVGEVLE